MIMSRELFPHLGVLLGQAWDPTYLASTWNVFKINMNGWQWLANRLRKCGWQGWPTVLESGGMNCCSGFSLAQGEQGSMQQD